MIAEFGGQLQAEWLPGIYLLPEAHKTAIVVIDELPLTEETLWLRILGRDATQQQAIAEVLALPKDAPRRSSVLRLLANWRITLEITGDVDEEERSLMTALSQAYLEWEQQTERRGIEQGERSLVLRLLTRRVGELPEPVRSQIEALPIAQLELLGEALLDFETIADLDAWLQQNP